MTPAKTITPQLLLWTELLLLWCFAAYGTVADSLKEEVTKFRWTTWTYLLAIRGILFGVLAYAIAGSVGLATALALFVVAQPLIRYRVAMRWVAEFECLCVLAFLGISTGYIWHFKLAPHWWPSVLNEPQAAAVCVTIATLIFIVRGGTYIVRGILRKAGTLPAQPSPAIVAEITTATLKTPLDADQSSTLAANSESATEVEILDSSEFQFSIDVKELNRGRLIGNLERIVLTIVVAAGSYSALGFLIAAKGLVRFEEFEKSREFTEYFLVGSLSSVLVALCAGLILRHALLVLWPELLAFQMQS
jgi:hypothetical protein